MTAVVSLLLVLMISTVVVHVSTVALVQTGMRREAAGFQTRSAWSASPTWLFAWSPV